MNDVDARIPSVLPLKSMNESDAPNYHTTLPCLMN